MSESELSPDFDLEAYRAARVGLSRSGLPPADVSHLPTVEYMEAVADIERERIASRGLLRRLLSAEGGRGEGYQLPVIADDPPVPS